MQLTNILLNTGLNFSNSLYKNIKIKNICLNSNFLKKGDLYISLKGKKFKGNYFIKDAINRGASAIITDTKYFKNKKKIPIIYSNNIFKKLPNLLDFYYKDLPQNIIAITGTNGKTSVCWYVSQILSLNKINSSYLGTVGEFFNGKKISELENTTPDICTLFSKANIHYNKGSNNFIFEASSHGIDQGRISGLPINIAAITNISQDHLDYHGNIESYKIAKFKLFTKYLLRKGKLILNSKVSLSKKNKKILKNKSIKIITYGSQKSDVYIYKKLKNYFLKINKKKYKLNLKISNKYDIENIECTISLGMALGIKIQYIIDKINSISRPPGRMEKCIILKNKSKVFIDFAHSPDALKNILKSTSKNFNIKPNLVFGCGGDRDKSKRKIMGKIANNYAKKVYITDDNPRNENANNIRIEISKNCKRAEIINNRKKAIITAIKELKYKEILIIAGKGHEKYQIIKEKKMPFDDFKIANNFIKKINKK